MQQFVQIHFEHFCQHGRLANALKTYAGITGDPTSNEYWGYVAVDAFITGLKGLATIPPRRH